MLSALLSLALSQPAALDDGRPWEKVSVKDGITLQQRSVPSSASLEFRISATTTVPADVMCEAIFEWATRGKDLPRIKARVELSSAPDERVVYDQLEQPVVSNRDYAMTVRRSRESAEQCRIRFWASNEKAPRVRDGWVRLDKMWGSWTFTQQGASTELVYTLFVEPGGNIPAFLANGTQRDGSLEAVRQALKVGLAWKR